MLLVNCDHNQDDVLLPVSLGEKTPSNRGKRVCCSVDKRPEAWGQWVDADRHRQFEAQPFGLTFWLPGYLGDSAEMTKTLSAWLHAYGGGTQLFWASVLFTVKKRFNVFLASLNEWCLSCEVSLSIAGTSYYSSYF